MSERIDIMEAWYRCPIHGDVHHPKGPNTEEPCPECEPSSLPFKSLKEIYDELGEGDRFKRVLDEACSAAGITLQPESADK